MKKMLMSIAAAGLLAGAALVATAADKLMIYFTSGSSEGVPLEMLEEVCFDETGEVASFSGKALATSYGCGVIDFMQFEDSSDVVEIMFADDKTVVRNPFAYEGVTVFVEGGRVTVTSTLDKEITYILSGNSDNGMFKLYSESDYKLTLNGLNLTSTDGAPINLQSEAAVRLELMAGTINKVADTENYTQVDGESMKGCFYTNGDLTIIGGGSLEIAGAYKHGLYSDKSICLESGEVNVSAAESDAVRTTELFRMNGGVLLMSPSDDGLDGDAGAIEINGGELNAAISASTAKAFKCDGEITINGGTFNLTMIGGVEVEEGDPSYCSGFKGKSNMTITDCDMTIVHSGEAGKGISVDGDLVISGGKIKIETTGDGATYTDADGVTDSYSATCIKVDGNMSLFGGEVICSASGSAGKGVSVDGSLTIGDEQNEPTLDVTTTGERFFVKYEESTSTGGWPGGGPGGGMEDNADYANPKAVKAEGNLTVNSGIINVKTTNEGGEGLESKSTLTINGGEITLNTYDDSVNAAEAVVITGGKTYCNSTGNDAIDSNGTLTISGGVVIAAGTRSPEGGFDCDQNQFEISGGVVIGMGGDSSTPTSSVCKQNVVIKSVSAGANQLMAVTDASGNMLAAFTASQNYGTMKLLFSHPDLTLNSSYTISKGGSVTDAEAWNGYYSEGTWSGGSTLTTFTQSSTVVSSGHW